MDSEILKFKSFITNPTGLRRFFSEFIRKRAWVWDGVWLPFLVTRGMLTFVGWFSHYYFPNPEFSVKHIIERGWWFVPQWFVDMWCRWDTGWYMSIVANGYVVNGDIRTHQSNLAFFPLYPYLIKGILHIFPNALPELIGILISNILLLIALFYLYKLVETSHDVETAQRTIWYLLIFPTAFFFSAVYTEATFLCLSILTFYAALSERWKLASVFGFLLALTRLPGALILLPILWIYFEKHKWRISKSDWNIIWFSLVPTGLIMFIWFSYLKTGNIFAFRQVYEAWGRSSMLPWESLFAPTTISVFIFRLDLAAVFGFLILGLLSLKWLRSASYGIYSLINIALILFNGSHASAARYCVVIFPAFMVLALMGRNSKIDKLIFVLFICIQSVLFVAWSRFYWVG